MNPSQPPTADRMNNAGTSGSFRRRQFLALGAGVGATFLAGCSAGTDATGADGDTTTSGDTGTTSATGTFKLLISDQPVAIDDFDELNVSFDRARIFRGEGAGDDEAEATVSPTATPAETDTATPSATGTSNATATDSPTSTLTATATPTATETDTEEDDDSDDGDQGGFFVIDLGGATVDLTQVVGDKAIGVFDGELPEGRYTKIELYAASVEGIVGGEAVNVMIPSGKLQIVKPFEVVAGETLSFVFDINVVQKGQTGEYNLLPVISESGVVGEEVEADVVGDANARSKGTEASEREEDPEATETEAEDTETSEDDDGNGQGEGGRPPDDEQGDS